MKYVDIVIDQNSRHTDEFFTYVTEQDLKTGDIVSVPFSRGNKARRGFVIGENPEPSTKIKEFKSIDEPPLDISLTEEMVETALWMKARYGIKYLDGLKCFVPQGKAPKPGKEKVPYASVKGEGNSVDELTPEQKEAVEKIDAAFESGKQRSFLIHGVTSSGKTEVYMNAIEKSLSMGRSAVMLVPEIALTKQMIERFSGRFGKENIAVMHSKLTPRERYDEWARVRNGEAKIVIGARIGVFAPFENIGVIIMDEEHEATYKSDQTPKYDTLDVAMKRLMYHKGVLILGSATPSVVSYQRAKEGIYELIEMKERYNRTPLPDVELVDMREELKWGNRTIFSGRLKEEALASLSAGRQVILFINRRGYNTFVSCRDCGEALKCSDCGISLVYHKRENAMVCHYCGKKYPVVKECPSCGSPNIRHFGVGTEQVEEFTRKEFPDKTVDRLDLDSAKNTREINRILSDFSKGKTDILIGTQLVAKGLDFKNVGLVGVISADVSLNIPDYRSTERTFQLVTQVAGRAGRGDEKGLVIVQSYTPDNFALTAAAGHDYRAFFENEIEIRKFMGYPPFTDLIISEYTSEDEDVAEGISEEAKKYLEKSGLPGTENIFGPRLSFNFKGQKSYRYHIMMKCPKGSRNEYIYYLQHFSGRLIRNKVNCVQTVDVNPYSAY